MRTKWSGPILKTPALQSTGATSDSLCVAFLAAQAPTILTFIALIGIGLSGCKDQADPGAADKSSSAVKEPKKTEVREPPQAEPDNVPDPAPPDDEPASPADPPLVVPGVDVSFISEDFAAALVLHPRRTLSAEAIRPLLEDRFVHSQWFGVAEKQLGFDVRKLDELVLLMGTPIPDLKKVGDQAASASETAVEADEAEGPAEDRAEAENAEAAAAGDSPPPEAPLPRNSEGVVNLDDLFFDLEPAKEVEEDPLVIDPPSQEPPGAVYGPAPHAVAGILRFDEPASAAAFITGFKQNMVESTHADKTYFRAEVAPDLSDVTPEEFGWLAVHFPDDKTVVLSSETTLTKMLTAGEVNTPLVTALHNTPPDGNLICAIDLERLNSDEAFTDLIDALGDFAGKGVEDLWAAIAQGRAATFSVDLHKEPLIRAELKVGSLDTAAELEMLLGDRLNVTRESLQETLPQVSQGVPERAVMQLVADVLGSADVSREEKSVLVDMQTPATVTSLTDVLRPVVEVAKEVSGRAYRKAQLKEIAFALEGYRIVNGHYPATASYDADGNPLLSWRVHLLPYLESGEELYDEFHLDEPWDSPQNLTLIDRMHAVYGDFGSETRIRVFTGPNTPFAGTVRLTRADIVHGLTKTIFCVRTGRDQAVPWTKPDSLEVDFSDPIKALGGIAAEGFEALFFDYSYRRIPSDIDADQLRRLIDPKDGEPVDLDFGEGEEGERFDVPAPRIDRSDQGERGS